MAVSSFKRNTVPGFLSEIDLGLGNKPLSASAQHSTVDPAKADRIIIVRTIVFTLRAWFELLVNDFS